MTGAKWPDRYGKAFGRGFSKTGNIEPFLAYKKLHRTGRLLKGIRAKALGSQIILSSSAPYTTEHEFGQGSAGAVIKRPYVQGGVSGVLTGGKLHARPFMRPSNKVKKAAFNLLQSRMRKYGWR